MPRHPIEAVGMVTSHDELAERLSTAGFIAADDESRELLACANGDDAVLEALVERRMSGEPLAWITGFSAFGDLKIRVDAGVYVPRWQSEPLARRAVARLLPDGAAIDLCTGSGAIAATLLTARPHARVVASDLDPRAVSCATSNGVETYVGDLFEPLPRELMNAVDVVVAVVPYVPTPAMSLLPRDTFAFESTLSYDGGPDGTDLLRRVVQESPRFLRNGGALLLELGGDQADVIDRDLEQCGFINVSVLFDAEADVRGIEATFGG